jgi:hypothetical protein
MTASGDYNRNGVTDKSDLATWRASFGATGSQAADGNGNGQVDAADYIVWRMNAAQSQQASGQASGQDASATSANAAWAVVEVDSATATAIDLRPAAIFDFALSLTEDTSEAQAGRRAAHVASSTSAADSVNHLVLATLYADPVDRSPLLDIDNIISIGDELATCDARSADGFSPAVDCVVSETEWWRL